MSATPYTPISDIEKIHLHARRAFKSGKSKSVSYRKQQLAQLGYMIQDNEQRFRNALMLDLSRPDAEAQLELSALYMEMRLVYDRVEEWNKTQRAPFNIAFSAMSPQLKPEPKGVVLIIAPFNYPLYLILVPLIGAIAGGNASVIKPSEQATLSGALLAELLPQYLDKDLYHVVTGGIPETTKLLEYPWNHIVYTGNGRVARVIASAAAKHLTPCTLELGGKNPIVIDPKTDVKLAAKRIVWGKLTNAGQTCASPDYVLVPEQFQDTLVRAIKEVIGTFYPDGPKNSRSLARIISKAHTERIKHLIDTTKGTIVFGGDVDVSDKYVAPTLVSNVKEDDSLMSEEIFGPVLLLVPIKDVDEAIGFINSGDDPLAVYVFSTDKEFQKRVIDGTKSGAVAINDTIIQITVPGLPLGGVGTSGYGYTGSKLGFDELIHYRVSIDSPSWVDAVGLGCRYPPYKSMAPLKMIIPSLPPRPGQKVTWYSGWSSWISILGVTSIVASVYLGGITLDISSVVAL